MDTLPVALWVILIVAAGCGSYLLGRSGRPGRVEGLRAGASGVLAGHQQYRPAQDVTDTASEPESGLADSAGLEHPEWCHRRGCVERGHHESEPIRCNADPAMEQIRFYVTAPEDRHPPTEPVEMLIVRVVLTQDVMRYRTGGPVNVEVAFWDVPEDRDGIVLTPVQARMVSAAILTLLAVGGLR